LGYKTHLSQLAHVLKAHGGTIIPYDLTKNSIIFDIQVTTEFLLKKYGLWQYVERNESALVAATVDGGQLARKLTQISTGKKLKSVSSIPGPVNHCLEKVGKKKLWILFRL
jgi:hypothetical protein